MLNIPFILKEIKMFFDILLSVLMWFYFGTVLLEIEEFKIWMKPFVLLFWPIILIYKWIVDVYDMYCPIVLNKSDISVMLVVIFMVTLMISVVIYAYAHHSVGVPPT